MKGTSEPHRRIFTRDFSFDPEKKIVRGLAIPWNSEGQTKDGTPELFLRGAMGDVAEFLPFNLTTFHERNQPVSGELKFQDAEDGLRVEARIAPTTRGRDTILEIENGIINGFSVEFFDIRASMKAGVKVVERALMVGLSLVDYGAYPGAVIEEVRQKEKHPEPKPLWRPRVWL